MQTPDWKKYLLVFIISALLFVTAGYVSNYFGSKKIQQLKSIQDNISLDILSSETQFSLLEDLSCKDVDKSFLSDQLNSLGEKIEYSDQNLGNNSDVTYLKKYYSLLEIKDYLLMEKISQRCGFKSVFVLYFYSTKTDCTDCVNQGYVLTALREKYPGLRVYSFDYNLDLSAIKALISTYKVPNTLPALIINKEIFSGFTSLDDIEKAMPALKDLLPKPIPSQTNTITK